MWHVRRRFERGVSQRNWLRASLHWWPDKFRMLPLVKWCPLSGHNGICVFPFLSGVVFAHDELQIVYSISSDDCGVFILQFGRRGAAMCHFLMLVAKVHRSREMMMGVLCFEVGEAEQFEMLLDRVANGFAIIRHLCAHGSSRHRQQRGVALKFIVAGVPSPVQRTRANYYIFPGYASHRGS